ncbi:MAG: hypothetical protein DWQ42_12295 [Planctomycetota bacterium]|nr:MAG: hypothetical protein DWQ42_12295 [Planctomycetota bacterium]REK43588.1 MAG: hypothetical protein DWQ46_10900 [Planctomycetota bacterium]
MSNTSHLPGPFRGTARVPRLGRHATVRLLIALLAASATSAASAKTITVAAGDDLQRALDGVEFGDVVELEAGATFQGNFILRALERPRRRFTDEDWITIRSTEHEKLPQRGDRVQPAHAKHMPKIVSANDRPALSADFGASRYHFLGLEFTASNQVCYNVILFGYDGLRNSSPATKMSQLPNHLVFDRCYIHGNPTGNIRRGIALNARNATVMDCYLSDFHEKGADSQAICAWNGSGPFKIVNNYLEAAGENVLFGGGKTTIPKVIPSDIEIRFNYFYKPRSWQKGHKDFAGTAWVVKNLLEFKNGRRAVIEGNIFENCWVHGQTGFAILFTPRTEPGIDPRRAVEDITFQKNLVRDSASGIQMANQHRRTDAQGNLLTTTVLRRIHIQDNIFWNIATGSNQARSRILELSARADCEPAKAVVIENNTFLHGGIGNSLISTGDYPVFAENFVFRNNITTCGRYGIIGTSAAPGMETVKRYFRGHQIRGNVFISPNRFRAFPPHNFEAVNLAAVGFGDPASGNFQLTRKSPFRGRGTDRLDPGADHAALAMALEGVKSGQRRKLLKTP